VPLAWYLKLVLEIPPAWPTTQKIVARPIVDSARFEVAVSRERRRNVRTAEIAWTEEALWRTSCSLTVSGGPTFKDISAARHCAAETMGGA
jgi:hypothetical protein